MTEVFEALSKACGLYKGEGINHEGQTFMGRFLLKSVLDGRGFAIEFTATGKDGAIYHQEESTIAPALNEKLMLWNFNTNIPGLVPHELRASTPKADCTASFVFGFNQPSEMNAFREEVALDIWPSGEVSYTYSWGLPGGEFKERSGLKMRKAHA